MWERAVRKLRGGMMPPPGMPRPDLATVNSFVTFLEASLDQAALASPNPGTVSLHRLNRAEYQNAMKDVLGVDVDAAALAAPRRHQQRLRQHRERSQGLALVSRSIHRGRARSEPAGDLASAAVRAGESGAAWRARRSRESAAWHAGRHRRRNTCSRTTETTSSTITGPNRILTIDGLPVSTNGFVHVTGGVHQLGLTAPRSQFCGTRRDAAVVRSRPCVSRLRLSSRRRGSRWPQGARRTEYRDHSVRSIPPASRWKRTAARGFSFASRPARVKKLPARPGFFPR